MNQEAPTQLQIKSVIVLYSNGQVQEALDSVQTLIKDYPKEALLHNICGACYAGLGQLDTAVKSYEQAIAIKPDYAEVHNNLGVTLQNLRQLDTAVKSYQQALALNPNYTEAHNNLGNTLKELGQFDEAVKSYEKAIAIKPDFADAHYNLGITFQGLSQLDAAVESYVAALDIKPDYAEAFNNLGVVLRELGQLETAVKSYEKVLEIKPDFAEAHNNLGVTLYELGQLDAALNCYEKAVAIKPDYAEAHNNLGLVSTDLGLLEEAIKHYKKAVAIKPDYAEAHNNLGSLLRDLGQTDDAIKNFKKAITIKLDFADAHYNLGFINQDLGQADEAVKQYEKAIAIKPDHAETHHNLSYLKNYTANDPQIKQMQSLLSSTELSLSDRIHLCLALARAYENLDKQDEFFEYLHEGNHLRKEELNYSLDKDQSLFSIIKKMFKTPPSLSYEPSTIRPIFILGMPRSGTSLVEQIIASHQTVYGAGELNTLGNLIAPIIEKFSTRNKNDLTKKDFLSIRQQYLDALSVFNVSENVITDKLPLNFRFIGFILSAFPEAKIVHLKRDARATCWSNYQYFFTNEENSYAFNLDDLAGFYGLYTDLMDFWHQTFPDKIYDLCYEDLTTNQEEETRKLLEYCELDWDENCLNFHTSKRAVKTASALQVRQKMYQGSSEAWKKHEAYLEPLIKALDSY